MPETGLKTPTEPVYAFWKNNTYSLVTQKEVVEVDVEKRTARFVPSVFADSIRKDATQVAPIQVKEHELAVRAATIRSDPALPATHVVELMNLRSKRATTLLNTDGPARVYSSPDRKRVAVSCILHGVPTIHCMSMEADAPHPKRTLARNNYPPGTLAKLTEMKSTPSSYVTTARCLADDGLLPLGKSAPRKDRTGLIADANRARLDLSEVRVDDTTLFLSQKKGRAGSRR